MRTGLDRSRRGPLLVLLILAASAGCTAAAPWVAPRERPELGRIRVEAGDIGDRPYLLLGNVQWPAPERANPRLRCTPDRLRARALEVYGDRVDGIVHFAAWKEGRQSVCEGIAVQFSDRR